MVDRIIFFGTPAFAVPSLEALVSRGVVVGLVSQPDRPRGRGHQLQPTPTKQVALAHGIPVLQPARIRDEAFLEQVRALEPDLGVVAAFGRIIPDALLAIPTQGMINVHASLLPKYRGAAPIQRAVMAGDTVTGVTIMRVVSELDAGPTFAEARVPIAAEATSADIERVLARVGAELLLDVLKEMAAGRAAEIPQDAALATYAPKVTKDESPLDWLEPARVLHDRVRGLQPWPLASTHFRGHRYLVRKTMPAGMVTRLPPGTIARAEADDLVVACGGGSALRILEIQPEGRRPLSARDFLAGYRAQTGDRFGA